MKKPAWLTTIPQPTKIKLWRLMVDNVTYSSWVDSVYRELNKLAGWEMDIKNTENANETNPSVFDSFDHEHLGTSRETYNKLRLEIRCGHSNTLRRLPSDIYPLIELISPNFRNNPIEVPIVISPPIGISPEKKAKGEPTWVQPFAARLRSTILAPDPIRFLVTGLADGEYPERIDGKDKLFCWDGSKGEATVRFYDTDSEPLPFIDDGHQWAEFMKRRPEIFSLVNRYRKCGKRYIVSANRLLLQMVNEGKKEILAWLATETGDRKPITSELNTPHSTFGLFDLRLKGKAGQEVLLKVSPCFFYTAYCEALSTLKDPANRIPWQYIYPRREPETMQTVRFRKHQLAEGPRDYVVKLVAIHKDLAALRSEAASNLAADVLQSAEMTRQAATKLCDEL